MFFSIQKILIKRVFNLIKNSIVETPSRLDSKILALSKSKSSLSKLKVHPSVSERNLHKKNQERENGPIRGENGIN
jgi:hypothetical protein